MEFGWVRNWEEDLREFLEEKPGHFRALHALVEGRSEEVTERQRRDLRRWGYLSRDLSPLPGVKAVMDAAVRQTPDGLCLVDPVNVKTPEEAEAVQRLDEQSDEQYKRNLKRLAQYFRERENDGKGEGEGTDRSR